MAIVTKTIRGRSYRYHQTSKRIGGKVKTTSIYIGPVGGTRRRKGLLRRVGEFIAINLQHDQIPDMDAAVRVEEERARQNAAKTTATLNELHEKYGLQLGPSTPVAVDKVAHGDNQSDADSSAGQQDAPSDSTEGADTQ